MPFNPEHQPGRQPYLPTFQEVMLTYDYEDSMRLPSYQARQLGRFHPYMRHSPRLEGPSSVRYVNTIYDEECVFLEVPSVAAILNAPVVAAVGPRVDTVVAGDVLHIPPNPPQVPEAEREGEPQPGEVRVNWLGGFLMVFLQGVRRAILAEATADGVATPEHGHDAQPGPGHAFAVETEFDRGLYGSVA